MNNLLLILFGILASCGMPVSDLYQNKSVMVISAEKTEWSGGRAGVKGITYTVKLKAKNNIIIKSLRAEGNTIPFSQNISGNIIVVKGTLQYKNNSDATVEDMPVGISTENTNHTAASKENWIEYTLKSSKVSHRISIPKFISVESHEEPAP